MNFKNNEKNLKPVMPREDEKYISIYLNMVELKKILIEELKIVFRIRKHRKR